MFEIDLLRGNGRPQRMNLKRTVLRLVLLLIPIGAGLVYAADLQRGRSQLEALRQTAADYETQLDEYIEDMRSLSQLKGQIDSLSRSLDDIGLLLRYRIVTSAMLVELAAQLPPDIFIREFQFRRAGRRERIEHEDSGKVYFEPVVQRTLRVSLCGYESPDTDAAVQLYLSRLNASPIVAPVVRDIRTLARRHRPLNETNAVFYELELVLKEQR